VSRCFTRGRPSEVELGLPLACTVGNRPEGLPGEIPVPEITGSICGGGRVTTGAAGRDTTTTSVAESVKEYAPLAEAVAEICTCSPSAAFAPTLIPASNSSAWPTGRLPTLQAEPSGAGQTVKVGVLMYAAAATWARTVIPALAALVVQTQTTKLATWPAFTCEELESDCTRTHSCGVFALGVGDGEVLVGLGLGFLVDVGLGLALAVGSLVGVGLGLLDAAVDEELPDGDGDALLRSDELALADGLGLFDELAPGDALADLVADLLGDAEAGRSTVAAVSDVLFGADEHAVLMIGGLAASTAPAWLNVPKPINKKPVSAPSAAGLSTNAALTCATSLR